MSFATSTFDSQTTTRIRTSAPPWRCDRVRGIGFQPVGDRLPAWDHADQAINDFEE